MTPPKKKPERLSPLAQLAKNARCGPGVHRRPFDSWAESTKKKLAEYVRQEPVTFGSLDFVCADLVIGLVLLDKPVKEIIEILKKRFGDISESVFNHIFDEEFKHGKDVADALVTNAAYQKAVEGNVQAIKIIGIKMGWLEGDGEGDEGEVNEILRVFLKRKQ